ASKPDLRDVFLCHAWDDRKGIAKELHDLLEAKGVSVWFSEKDVLLGSNLMREIDKGLAKSRIGIVMVTPSFLKRIAGEGVADKELSALLSTDLLVPIVHDTTYEDLRDVSPLLGSRSGLDTAEDPIGNVASKLAELVAL
ncbi:toll/interleukin-1 receptor domain-containing protein, partial [Vibrio anguillarum]